jgi:hypothetical protein
MHLSHNDVRTGEAANSVHDDEVVALVLVGLRTLSAAEGVLECQLMESELSPEEIDVIRCRVLDVQPQERPRSVRSLSMVAGSISCMAPLLVRATARHNDNLHLLSGLERARRDRRAAVAVAADSTVPG